MNKIKFKNIKKNKKPIVCLTAYSKVTAEIADKHCDIVLVGDSLGMTLYGFKSTKEVKIETMINHAKTVKKFATKSLIVFDMPYKTYTNKFKALKNAKTVISKTQCDAVKLEGGRKIVNIIKHLVKNKIPVMGHIGLLPQFVNKFKTQGKKSNEKKNILKDAIALSEAGTFAVVVECVIESLAKKITNSVPIPTIGIGSSKYCDGQILVIDDILGLSDFSPKFVKRYSNLKKLINSSIKNSVKDVKKKRFPTAKNTYK